MNVLLATDNETQGAAVRQILLREGLDCPVSNVVRVDVAPRQLAKSQSELIIVMLPVDHDRALGVLDWLERLPRPNGERVVAVGPTANAKTVLRALRGAVDDYLDETELETELEEALVRWRSSLAKREESGRVIAVLAPNGGAGSSTLAVNLAVVLAGKHRSAALVDLKLVSGDLAALLDLKPTHTLADLCQNVTRMDRSLFEHSLVRHRSGVQLLASPGHYDDVARITPEGVRQALTLAKAAFPYVVVDLDHSFHPEQVEVLHQAEIVLLVFRLDFVSLRNARRALEYLERLGLHREQIKLVVNRYGQPKEIPAFKAEEALGMKVSYYIPDDPKAVNRAINNGIPVMIDAPRASVSRSVAKLAENVNGRLAGR
jgi:pilus assembly protein CpaE